MTEPLAFDAPSRIRPGLYLGALESLTHAAAVNATHILSLGPAPDEEGHRLSGVKHLHIDIQDTENANLLQHLDKCCAHIGSALGGGEAGCVLVHCHAGMSRSAAAVVAYLGRSEGLTVDEALASVRAAHPSANPNYGFMQQLQLYQEMGYALDPTNAAYKRFALQQLGQRWEDEGCVEAADLGEVVDGQQEEAYRCRTCRALVATSTHAVPVEPGAGGSAFSFSKRAKQVGAHTGRETSLFVQPLRWMDGAIGQVNGKLYCPKCSERLGSYNWAGIQSNSGTWVTPAFQLHMSKLDTISPRLDSQLAGRIARPRQAAPEAGDAAARLRRCGYLVFDCDGVLVDSEPASCEALHQAVLEVTGVDIPHAFPQDYYPLFGMDVRSSCRHYADTMNTGWDVEAVAAQVTEAKERHYKALTAAGIVAFSHVHELVARAKDRGMVVGVGSSGSPEKIAHNLASAGLAGLFPGDLVVSAKAVARGKPAPDVYQEVMRRMECAQPDRVAIIEDAVNGLKAARAAGALAVGITNTLPRVTLAPHADLVVGSLAELAAMLL
eukprot:jgi/Tetstr1/428125/TSEL_018177.t2